MDEHQRNQYRHEIRWIENKIDELARQLDKQPSKQREIDDLRRQIREREYQIDLGV